jgi:hypothetical protein
MLKKQGLIQEAFIEFHSKPNVGRFPKASIARFFSITIFICNIKHITYQIQDVIYKYKNSMKVMLINYMYDKSPGWGAFPK